MADVLHLEMTSVEIRPLSRCRDAPEVGCHDSYATGCQGDEQCRYMRSASKDTDCSGQLSQKLHRVCSSAKPGFIVGGRVSKVQLPASIGLPCR